LLTVILPPSSFFDEPNLELTLVSTFLSFSPIATFLPKSAPGVGENGSLQLNRSIKGLEGQLKIRVMAGDFNATLLLCPYYAHNDKHMSLYSDLKDCMPTHLH
jgi:hypothetical protein